MKIEKEFVLREIAGDYILVPVGKTALDFNGLITLNELGVFLWNHLQEETTIERLVSHVLEEYEIDHDTATQDVIEFVDSLKESGIVTE